MELTTSNELLLVSAGIFSLVGNSLDLRLLTIFGIGRHWDIFRELIDSHVNIKIVIDTAKTLTALLITLQIYRYIRGLHEPETGLNSFIAEPMLFPCRTSHTRLFPKKHSFSFSYLVVGIPIGWKGSTGGMISSDISRESSSWYWKWISLKSGGTWFTVNGDDYLARGHVEGGLEEKLHDYLRSQVRLMSKYITTQTPC